MARRVLPVLAGIVATASASKFVMPWMCLERCGGNESSIQAALDEFKAHQGILTAVSFEVRDASDVTLDLHTFKRLQKYNLGPNSTLVRNNLTNPLPAIQKLGLASFPMVSSFPYPKQFIEWMRQVFANPKPFINELLQEIQANGFSGVNIDWEPTTPNVTPEDAIAYATFLDMLAESVHSVDAILTVDIAHWGPIWNFTALAATSVDHFMTMGTYTDDAAAWTKYVDDAVRTFSPEQLVVGLETTKATNGQPYSVKELQQRFQYLQSKGVTSVGLWKAPVPATFWPLLASL